MLFVNRVPRLLRWIISVLLIFLAVMTIYRFVFLISYNPPGKPFSGSSMLMGLRFDLKFTCMLGVGMLVLCAIPFLNPFKKPASQWFWNILLTLVFLAVLVFYAVDYYYYAYVQQRLNANIISYLVDTKISSDLVWETYPVIKIFGSIFIITILVAFGFRKNLMGYQTKYTFYKRNGAGYYVFFFLLFALGIFGKLGQFNLRWSDAFTLNNSFKANLSLNPFQSFFSTLRFMDTRPDIDKVKKFYPLM